MQIVFITEKMHQVIIYLYYVTRNFCCLSWRLWIVEKILKKTLLKEDDPSSGSTLKEKWNSSVSSINPEKTPCPFLQFLIPHLHTEDLHCYFETLFPPPTQLNRNSKFEPSVTGQTDKYDKSGGNRTKRRNKRELRRDGPRRGRVHISLSPRGWRGKVKVKGKRSCPGG